MVLKAKSIKHDNILHY